MERQSHDRGSLRKNGNKIQVEKEKAGGDKIKKEEYLIKESSCNLCVDMLV